MATIAEEQALAPEVARAEPQAAPAGDPAILGLPIFVVVFAALGVYLFLSGAEAATGGSAYPLGPALRR